MDNRLETQRFYGDDTDYATYLTVQKFRHAKKRHKFQKPKYYNQIFENARPFIREGANIICMGSRNNYERSFIGAALHDLKVNVKSLDIGEKSDADYMIDFSNLPQDWNEKWDVIFSNSIDHAINPTATFFEWMRTLKADGIIIIQIDITNQQISEKDCNKFSLEQADRFISFYAIIIKTFLSITRQPVYIVGKKT